VKPQVPPQALILVCPLSKAEQARKIGVSIRNFYRMIAHQWSEWRIWQAEKWCSACGVSFWDLKLPLEMIQKIDWSSKDPAVVDGVAAIYEMNHPGLKATRKEIVRVGAGINRAFGIKSKVEEEVECGSQG
jgi:hypothetical protein